MEMQQYFLRLNELISIWVEQIKGANKTGSMDINQFSEFIAAPLLNAAFSYNMNVLQINHPAVDLGDQNAGISFQITSRTDNYKIIDNLEKFKNKKLTSQYPNGMRFLLLVMEKPRWEEKTKNKAQSILTGFDADKHIYDFTDIIKEMKTRYLANAEAFRELLDMMEWQFGNKTGVPPLAFTRLWLRKGSQSYYKALRGPTGRFRFLKISDILFPGTESQWLESHIEIDEKSQDYGVPYGDNDPTGQVNDQKFLRGAGAVFLKRAPARRRQKKLTISHVLPMLWQQEVKHAVIIGEGGMGKTVSLLQWWENLLGQGVPEEKSNPVPVPVPVFIALNEFNQVSEAKREGFILETIRTNYGLGKIAAGQIESLMKTPLQEGEEFIPSMVLLLDGFNEITVEKRLLLVELNRLAEQFPGVQVIMTSRYDMRGNFNWNHWHPVRLKELEDKQVGKYLQKHAAAGTAVPVKGQGRLWKLLKNPMMLTLYAASCEVQKNHRDSRYCSFKERVDSPGELLWNFIEAQAALLPEKVGPSEERVFYYWFLLKYLLPGLGFAMEKAGLFAFTYTQFREHLDRLCLRFSQGDFLDTVPQLDKYLDSLPVGECADEKEGRKRAALLREIFCGELVMLVEEGESLRFLHQDFRDFFAAVHGLNEVEVGIREKEIPTVLKERILDYYVRRYMGEIEGEHRCVPFLVEGEGWKIDINKENRLYRALELCHGKFGHETQLTEVFGGPGTFLQKGSWPPEAKGNVDYAVLNIVTIWKEVRGELTGADLGGLDLTGVMLNGVRCSRFYDYKDKGGRSGGGTRYLGVEFGGSRVHEKSLLPQGHTGFVTSAVYSRDGQKILSASWDNTIKEWDAGTGECVQTLAGHTDIVTSAVYSRDGRKILSASVDNTINEWDAGTGECMQTLAGHTSEVTSAVYSRDGQKILSASRDNTIKEWDAGTGACVKTLAGHTSVVTSAVYSPDGRKILSTSLDHTIEEWDAGTGACVKTLAGHTSVVTSAVYSRNGQKILSASLDNTIKEWDAGSGECVKTLAGHTSVVTSAVYSPDGQKILSASNDYTIKEWDAGTGECMKTLAGHTSGVIGAVYSKDGQKILSASWDNTIKEWDTGTGECVKTLAGHMEEVNSAVYSRDGQKILSASRDGTIKEWDAGTGECMKTLAGHMLGVTGAVYSPDGRKILSASNDYTIKEWDTGTGECVQTLAGHMLGVTGAVYSREGRKILSASADSTIKEWDAGTGECVQTLAGHRGIVTSAVYSPDGQKILSTSWDKTIKEWDAGTGECVKTLAGHTDIVNSAVYNRDGQKILSASRDHTIKEWDVGTGQCLDTHDEDDHPGLDLSQYPDAAAKLKTDDNKIFIPAAPGEEKERVLLNFPGLFIQGCSFRNLEKGSQWTEEGLRILKQYGALL